MAPIDRYDVVIAGGGPAGATLAATLAKNTSLRIAVVEKERFPRDHIGESFIPNNPHLAQSGALEKVLSSDCWVKKFGGIYAWDPEEPARTFFNNPEVQRDGIHAWAMHVNRAEFDEILLRHAASLGVEVLEGREVEGVENVQDGVKVKLRDASDLVGRLFVDATGRTRNLFTGQKMGWLSASRNVAFWTHVVDGKPAETIDAKWNIFREQSMSAIGCFAFEDGWFWYIPVPRTVNGKRQTTHSLGLITDPEVLKRKGKDLKRSSTLLELASGVPWLRDLVGSARPVYETAETAANYNMISNTLGSYDDRWLLLGDSAFFVDPLFSTGVTFVLTEAIVMAKLIHHTLDDGLTDDDKRSLWRHYDISWRNTGRLFALLFDQWYLAISRIHGGPYWQERIEANEASERIRSETFQSLVDASVPPPLMAVLSKGSNKMDDLEADGPLLELLHRFQEKDVTESTRVKLRDGVGIEERLFFEDWNAYFRLVSLSAADRRKFWADSLRYRGMVPSFFHSPLRHGLTFSSGDGDEDTGVDIAGMELASDFTQLLKSGISHRQIEASGNKMAGRAMRDLLRAGLLEPVS